MIKSDEKILTSVLYFIGDNLTRWRSEKREGVSRSNAKVKYRAMAYRVCEIMRLKTLEETDFHVRGLITMHYDNRMLRTIRFFLRTKRNARLSLCSCYCRGEVNSHSF